MVRHQPSSFSDLMRMAFEAFPSQGPDVTVKTELVGLSADDADRVSSDYLQSARVEPGLCR